MEYDHDWEGSFLTRVLPAGETVSVAPQKGDDGEEGVTSEGTVTKLLLFIFPPFVPLATPTSTFATALPLLNHSCSIRLLPEFDKFLEERAKAAEMTPGMPSPPSGEPGAAQGTPKRKKAERPDESLLAM